MRARKSPGHEVEQGGLGAADILTEDNLTDAGVKRLTQRSVNLPETLLQLSHEDVYVAGQKTNPRGNQYK